MKIIQNNKEINYQLQLTKSRSSLISGVKSLVPFTFATTTAQLVPSSTDATKCLQFGPQAKISGELSTIKVTVPAGEVWTVKISASVPRQRVASADERNTWVAIVEEITDRSTTGAKWLSTMASNHAYTDGGSFFAVRTLSAGTYYYGLAGWSEEAASTTWSAGASEYRTTVPTNADGAAGPAYILMAELLQKSNEDLDSSPNDFDPYNVNLGTILAVAECSTTKTGSSTDSLFNSGTWVQYGPMKKTSNMWSLTITAPANEDWYIELSAVASKFRANEVNNSGIGIAKVSGTSFVTKYCITTSASDSAQYTPQICEKVVKLDAGTSADFAIYINGNGTIAGPDTTASFIGPSATLKATLVDKVRV